MHTVRCNIRENSWVAQLAAWRMKSAQVAIVFGHTIHLHGTTREEFLANRRWVRHEVCHVKQYRTHGFLPFLWLYLVDWVRVGYWQNRFEIAARLEESNEQVMDDVEII